MSSNSQFPAEDDDLQFDVAEPTVPTPSTRPAAPAQHCLVCRQQINSTYYAIRDKMICPSCCAKVQAKPPGSKFARLVKATGLGLGAGLVGALIWFLIRRFAHLEIGIVAILVGFMVGKAVRKGSGNRGGRGYQVLAVVLTYCCIAANYMPDVLEGLVAAVHDHHSKSSNVQTSSNSASNTDPTNTNNSNSTTGTGAEAPHAKPGALKMIVALVVLAIVVFVFSLAAPFLGGAQSVIGLLIIGFALWEAWKFNAYRPLPISGPYQIGAGGTRTISGVVA
jgi:hypothetical protein